MDVGCSINPADPVQEVASRHQLLAFREEAVPVNTFEEELTPAWQPRPDDDICRPPSVWRSGTELPPSAPIVSGSGSSDLTRPHPGPLLPGAATAARPTGRTVTSAHPAGRKSQFLCQNRPSLVGAGWLVVSLADGRPPCLSSPPCRHPPGHCPALLHRRGVVTGRMLTNAGVAQGDRITVGD